jgi:hypothetical protein
MTRFLLNSKKMVGNSISGCGSSSVISPDLDFESGPPGEDSFVAFLKYLRLEKKYAPTTLWTWYSCMNSMIQRKNMKLQNLPRLTMVIKGFDMDVKEKALIFDEAEIKTFMLANMESAFWFLRQAITIVAFFGGLPLQECQDLKLEKIIRTQDGLKIVHCCIQQRSDQLKTPFIVPTEGRFADRLAVYLHTCITSILDSTTTAVGCGGPALRSQFSRTLPWAGT